MNRGNNVRRGFAGFIILVIGFQSEALAAPSPAGADRTPNARLVETYGKLPLSFEENQGQTGEQVKFLSRGPGYTLFLTPTEAVLSLHKPEATHQMQPRRPSLDRVRVRGKGSDSTNTVATTLRMKLIGANPKLQVSGVDTLPGKVNYLRGNDPKQWRTNVPTYAKVKYENVWPGIDLVHYGNQRQLEHDFVVAPGADPGSIRLEFAGAEKLAIDEQGDLVLKTAVGDVRLRNPRVYQDIKGQRREIEGRYVLHSPKTQRKTRVGFQVAAYDKAKPLIIDPVLVYSTYLGGSSADLGYSIAIDSAGNAYIAGATSSPDFPTANPLQGALAGVNDAFVAKLDAAGAALVYSTYLGGSFSETGQSIAVDSAGNAYIAGATGSPDFPTANPLQGASAGSYDAFVAKLDAAGAALVYSTYLGGSSDDWGLGIAVDSAGNAYIAGATSSPDFPTANPLQGALAGVNDAFVAKLDAAGAALVYSTYLGGSFSETGQSIAVDSAGNAYVTGWTTSTDFPTANPLQGASAGVNDAFVAKLDAAGSALVYSTYLGGSSFDIGQSIAVDSAGQVYVTGGTDSTDFPTANPNPLQGAFAGVIDAFVAKLDAAGSALVYSTYLGGSNVDLGKSIAVDSAGNAYVTGWTTSTDFPTANPLQGAWAGRHDAFVGKLDAAGSALVYCTYLGGSGDDDGWSIAVDSTGNAYVTGGTGSTDFPTTNALEGSLAGSHDGFVAKISGSAPLPRVATVYLLLHGTASDHKTWDHLVRDRFAGSCPVTELGQNLTADSVCYRIEFADRPFGDIWKNGDGSKFDELGKEVELAINKIEARMHPAAIILVGHSRGGLAARAYLQKIAQQPPYKLGLLTIGTPHQGTPLGRVKHCLTNGCLGKKFKPKNVSKIVGAACIIPGGQSPTDCVYQFKAILFSPSAGYQATEHNSAGNPVRTGISKHIHALNAGARRLDDWVITFGQIYSYDLRLGQNIVKFVDLLDNGRRLGSLGRWLVPGDFIELRKYVFKNIVSSIKTTGASFCVKADRTYNNWACNGDGVAPTISQRLTKLPGFSKGNKPLHSTRLARIPHTRETGQTTEITKILAAMRNDL